MNAVVIAVCLLLVLAVMRVNVILALVISALAAGLLGGLNVDQIIEAFNGSLADGAKVALSYALLGAFAVALSRSGVTTLLSNKIVLLLGQENGKYSHGVIKTALMVSFLLMAISSQNILPIHIAFIPMIIPPLLHVLSKLKIDRRLISCILVFGLVTTYMVIPVGFGGIFLNEILLKQLVANGLDAQSNQMSTSMIIPAIGMAVGLLIAFFSYRKPREYKIINNDFNEVKVKQISTRNIILTVVAIVAMLVVQLETESMTFGAMVGFMVFSCSGILKPESSDDVFTQGVCMMASIGFIMIAASGFAGVIDKTGEVDALIKTITVFIDFTSNYIDNTQAVAAFLMLLTGLFITMGIGSSFSTVPIIAIIYVPLAMELGFSTPATIALIGTAAALGDAGSPASESTLGPTAGLNADGQHNHIHDTVIPTFIHYNIPLLISGWIAAAFVL